MGVTKEEKITAIEGSIAHWQRMHDDIVGCFKNGETPSTQRCALCVVYRNGQPCGRACNGCPVAEFTGEISCEDIPYDKAWRCFRKVEIYLTDPLLPDCISEFRDAARQMLDFLNAVLDKEMKA